MYTGIRQPKAKNPMAPLTMVKRTKFGTNGRSSPKTDIAHWQPNMNLKESKYNRIMWWVANHTSPSFFDVELILTICGQICPREVPERMDWKLCHIRKWLDELCMDDTPFSWLRNTVVWLPSKMMQKILRQNTWRSIGVSMPSGHRPNPTWAPAFLFRKTFETEAKDYSFLTVNQKKVVFTYNYVCVLARQHSGNWFCFCFSWRSIQDLQSEWLQGSVGSIVRKWRPF